MHELLELAAFMPIASSRNYNEVGKKYIYISLYNFQFHNQIKSNIYSTHFTMIVYKYLEKYG